VWNRGGAAQGGEPGEQGQRVHLHRKRAASERTFQNDAHEAVVPSLDALLCDRRAEDVPQKRLLARGVVAAGSRRRVQREAVERRTEGLVVPERARLRPSQAPLPGGARLRRTETGT